MTAVFVLHLLKSSFLCSLSCKYSMPGKRGRRTRLMLVNQVALGKHMASNLKLKHVFL